MIGPQTFVLVHRGWRRRRVAEVLRAVGHVHLRCPPMNRKNSSPALQPRRACIIASASLGSIASQLRGAASLLVTAGSRTPAGCGLDEALPGTEVPIIRL